jgi:hypothetical protein
MFKAIKSMKQKRSRGLFNDAFSIKTTQRQMVGHMNYELENIRRRRSWPNNSSYPRICMKGLRKTKRHLRIADVSAEIRSEHHPNTNLERYLHTNLFRVKGSNQSLPQK